MEDKLHPCPICGAEMEYSNDRMDYALLEEHFKCPNLHYMFDYEHGVCSLFVGSDFFNWNWHETIDERRARVAEIELSLNRQKRLWSK